MNRRVHWAASVGVTLAVAVFSAAGAATSATGATGTTVATTATTTATLPSPEPVRLLDVPYVPQGEALCGGAAVAMVLRYWGDGAAQSEDFAAQLGPDGSGIRADRLVSAVRARGWTAVPLAGTAPEVRAQLARGRPVIALVRVATGAYHYIVIVAWANGGVIVHDPALAPFQVHEARAFDAAWAGSGRWALLVLPPARAPAAAAATDSLSTAASPPLTGCDAIVDDAVRRAHAGDAAGAEQRLLSAAALCPASASPLRGLAGLRFQARDWAGAAGLAERALALDASDAYTWRLLAGSRFLLGDEIAALRAWNRVSEPRADLARVDGLVRTRYRAVSAQLALPPGRLVTAGAWLRARRRLAEIPAQSSARLQLRPLPEGSAQLNASVLERPLLFDGPLDALGTALRAGFGHEASLRLASPAGYGELWTAAARWQRSRPRAALTLAIPAGGGHPGIWHVEGSWERQSYALVSGVRREEHRRSALAFSDWVAPSARLEVGAALDRWADRGTHAALETRLEVRLAGDRLALVGQAGEWASLERGVPFRAGSLAARWGPPPESGAGWSARVGAFQASARAPLSLWPGAGTGSGRASLLRAHPLLADGVVTGRGFGRALVTTGLEREGWATAIAALHVGWSVFVDAARPWDGPRASTVTSWLVDGGVSLRVAGPGGGGTARLSAAHGFVDGTAALSLAWEAR